MRVPLKPPVRTERRRRGGGRLGRLRASAAVAAVLVLAAWGCGRASAGGSQDGTGPERTLAVRRGTFVRRVLLTGEVKAGRAAAINVPRTSEWEIQIKWLEKDGAAVKAGDRVVEFDSSPFASGLEDKRLAALRARRDLEQEQAQDEGLIAESRLAVEKAGVSVERARIEAAIPEDLLSRRDYQERQLALEKAKVELEKANDRLAAAQTAARTGIAIKRIASESAGRDVKTAEDAIASLVVRAPRDGLFQVTENRWEGRKYQTGDSVWVGLVVALIPEPSSLMVEAALVDVDDGLVRPGMPAVCTLDTYPGRTYAGRVLGVSPVAEEPARGSQRRAFSVDVGLDAVDVERMRVGMSVKVAVEAEHRPDVLLVPRAALDLDGDGPAARLADGRSVPVKLGPCSAQECVVVSGLGDGSKVAPRAGGNG